MYLKPVKINFMNHHQSKIFYLTLFIISVFACSEHKERVINPVVRDIVRGVSTAELENTISDLVSFETRWTYQKQLEAANYLHDRMNFYISNTFFDEYEFWGVTWKNVVASIPGKIHPEEVVIVCAHLDSKSEQRLVYAPGADDNASGCSSVLELARILSNHIFEKSIRFMFFSREESGWEGSAAYLKTVDRNNEKIFAAINMDMIAYGGDDEDIDLVTRPEYSWLAENIYHLAYLYGIDIKKIIDKHCY